ncbi:flagellar biosynthesis protein FlhB [Viridibacterium curvum]|uniref:Flagellar biosynthetic protein FlhB n=1 Tax=Viridibacterium curvum TaxID=1101404 RepID=A0ABP9QCC9_9RHOO
MAEDSDLEKTEPASGRKLEQAREEGKVPRSRELSSFLVLVAGVLSIWTSSGWIYERLSSVMRHGLSFDHQAAFSSDIMTSTMLSLSADGLLALAPILVVVVVVGVVSHMLLGGVVISSKSFQFDLTRMDPISGMRRFFSVNGLIELVKGTVKAACILGIAGAIVWKQRVEILMLMSMPLHSGLITFMQMLVLASLALSASLALIAAIDVPYQVWHYFKELRMSKADVKQENKESEGDPQVKGKIRQRQNEMARRRMMDAVPKADVVVTNPTHFAVALKYDAGRMGAPTVVAKGADLVAKAIRDLAARHAVPMLEAPPLARALFHHAKVDEQIPTALYTAVAEVMAYVYQLNEFLVGKGLPPQAPNAIAVPAGMDPFEGRIDDEGAGLVAR